MTTPPSFPSLPGQGWSVHKKPTFSTRISSHVSGREVRIGLNAHALYEFELTFDALDSSGAFPGLQTESLQTLMGFFLTCGGQFSNFLYSDPTDNSVTNGVVGTGDSATTAFTLGRAMGAFWEPVSYVTGISGITVAGVQTTAYSLTPPNTLNLSDAPASGAPIGWSGSFAFLCRFLDDQMDFENFMSGAWAQKSMKFRQIR